MAIETADIALRLAAATFSGLLIGIDRDQRDKPAGMRTLALVALGAALVAVTAASIPELGTDPNAFSRVMQGVIQGVIAGIGFIGAGAILHRGRHNEVVHGVTTAATVWVSAALGIACGLGQWRIVVLALALVFIVLIIAKPLERMLLRKLDAFDPPDSADQAGARIDRERQQHRVENEGRDRVE